MKKYNKRGEVEDKYKWDLSDIFKSDEEFYKKLDEVKPEIKKLNSYKNKLNNSDALLEYLNLSTEIGASITMLDAYAFLKLDVELGKEENLKMKNEALNLYIEYNTNTSFFNNELLSIKEKDYKELFNKNKKLLEYKSYLDEIYRYKAHILDEKEEIIVNNLVNAANTYSDISSTILNSENNYGKVNVDGETIIITTSNFSSLMRNKDLKLRKKVYNSFYKKIDEYSNTLASLLNSYVKLNDEEAKVYKYENAWDRKLFGLNLSNKVFDTLVNTTLENLNFLHKYYELKKEALGLDELTVYDLNLPLSGKKVEYSVEDAKKICLNMIKPLGEDYIKHFERIFDNNHIDYFPYKGKRSGGYMVNTPLAEPKILMNYNYDFESVSTIAHEGGHDVNYQYINETNPIIYRGSSTMVAEVMSLTNECLLSHYMLENGKTKNEKLIGLENIMKIIVSNLYGAVREGKIERDMYKIVEDGGVLTKEVLNNLVSESLDKYYDKFVKRDKLSNLSWATRSHYYMDYYLYSYAICISVASNIALKITENDKDMLEKYNKLLKVGSDVDVYDAFKILGIDLEDKEVYENAFKYFNSLIDKYRSLM